MEMEFPTFPFAFIAFNGALTGARERDEVETGLFTWERAVLERRASMTIVGQTECSS
jgi:hypothetical protein